MHLLPAWDEYTVAYRDRGAFLDAAHASRTGNGIFKPALLADGRIAGTWKRTVSGPGVGIASRLVRRAEGAAAQGLRRGGGPLRGIPRRAADRLSAKGDSRA